MKMTVAEFAAEQGVDVGAANGFVNFLVAKGVATKCDEGKKVVGEDGKAKKGRPASVFELPDMVDGLKLR